MSFVTMTAINPDDLQQDKPEAWRGIKAALIGLDLRPTVEALATRQRVAPAAVLLTGFLVLLNQYAGYDLIRSKISTNRQEMTRDVLVSLNLETSTALGALAAAVERQLSSGGSETSQAEQTPAPVYASIFEVGEQTYFRTMERMQPNGAVMGLACRMDPESLHLEFRYREDVMQSWFVEQMMEHFAAVLNVWLTDPDAGGERLALLGEVERSRIFRFSEGDKRQYPLDVSLPELFDRQAKSHPERIALLAERGDGSMERLTYGAVDQRASVLANRLAACGVGTGVAVGVHLQRSPELIISLLAILKAGGVYVPLDRAYPAEYLRYILDDTQARVVITSGSQSGFHAQGVQLLNLDELDWTPGSGRLSDPLHHTKTSDPFVIMYTSGSTGKPKGVKHCQLQVINRLHWMWQDYPFEEQDVLAQRSPMNVMPSAWELLGGLLAGVPTVIVPDALMQSPPELAAFLAEHRVSFMTITPALLRLMLRIQEHAAAWPSQLRILIIGGEPLTEQLYRDFRHAFPHTTLVNDFGATEVNTILHAPYPASYASEVRAKGYIPIANVSTYLLDDNLNPVPFGVQGEICVSGVNVALGYHNLPHEMEKRFPLWRPAADRPEQRLYRTGDLGYMTPDGYIRITGRKDHMVKINGLRVELGEIERVLNGHPEVRESVVIDDVNSRGKKVLHAFLHTLSERKLEERALVAYVQEHLPAYMTPNRFEKIDQLPRLHNGKLDRMTLRRVLAERKQVSGVSGASAASVVSAVSVAAASRKVRELAGSLLDMEPSTIEADMEFAALGFDSVLLIEYAQLLSDELDLSLSVSTLFEQATVRKLTEFVGQALRDRAPAVDREAQPVSESSATGQPSDNAVAVIGMSGRFPGARNIREFWSNLCQGIDSVTTVPAERWDVDAIFDPDRTKEYSSYSKWGGFLSDVDRFEPLFFNISPKEARLMDPQQRLCLMEAWSALEDAGYEPNSLRPYEAGVFVGAREADYAKLVAEAGIAPGAESMLGNDMALLAARISYFCNLRGPSLVVDTACSSSMVALHLACQSLLSGESRMMLVGGVCVTNDPDFYVGTSKMNVFSPTGRCKTFDDDADGFVHGEGVVFVVLKPLRDAVRDGDHIYSVIRGTSINQDGRSNGITAPNGESQTELQESLYRRIGIDPETIGYVEAHGTATRLGDLIEMESLTRTFRKFTEQQQYCAIGSVKTNIGHLTAAAGLAAVVKTSLCLQHRELVPSLHFQKPNALVDFAKSPFYVNTAWREWQHDAPRRAVINSFGIGGTNAHCVLEEAPFVSKGTANGRPAYLIPITARTEESMQHRILELEEWIRDTKNPPALRDISYTLCKGRKFFDKGILLVADSLQDLAFQLRSASTTARRMGGSGSNVRLDEQGRALLQELGRETMPSAYAGLLHHIADLIAEGFRPDWDELFRGESVRRVSLPTYPFLKERCWVPTGQRPTRASEQDAVGASTPSDQMWSELLIELLGEQLGVEREQIDLEAGLETYGFDSIKAVGLKYKLEVRLGTELSLDELLANPSLRALSKRLAELSGSQAVPLPESPIDSAEDLLELFLEEKLDPALLTDEQLDQLHALLLERGAL